MVKKTPSFKRVHSFNALIIFLSSGLRAQSPSTIPFPGSDVVLDCIYS